MGADLARRVLGPSPGPWRIACACASGLLLALSYPRPGIAGLAWIALVPLLASIVPSRRCPRPWRLGFLAGLVWTVPNLAWLRYVTVPGWLALAAYVAVYPAVWSVAAARWTERAGDGPPLRDVSAAFLAAAWWIGLEYLRSRLFTGFPWNFLGASQYRQTALIQVARIGGVYAVSFLVAFVNTALFLSLRRWIRVRRGRRPLMPHMAITSALLLVALAVAYGLRTVLRESNAPTRSAGVALVQGNIPQRQKWDEAYRRFILGQYDRLTREAAERRPDLIVWPESSTPDDVRYDPESFALVGSLVADTGIPLLVGSGDYRIENGGEIFTNTAFLFAPADDEPGAIRYTGYDKIRLVPFGEYVPLERLGVTRLLTPIAGSFRPGREVTVFELGADAAFSTLICFEDVFAELARAGVRRGARFLVNITNDAWYERSSGAFQHAANAVFRAAETGAPLVRAANTGVTCFIDRFGRIESVLEGDEPGYVWIDGVLHGRVEWIAEPRLTFYVRHGDLPALAGLAAGIAGHIPFLTQLLRLRAGKKGAPG